MKSPFTVHIMPSTSRNTTRLMSFMKEMDFEKEQKFIIYGKKIDRVEFSDVNYDVEFVDGSFLEFIRIRKKFLKSRKIVVHGFFSVKLALFFWLVPVYLKKVYWVVWGGDLYSILESPKKPISAIRAYFKLSVLKRIDNIVTYIPGDYELIKLFVNSDANLFTSLMYPGNLYKDLPRYEEDYPVSECRVLVGNSGSPSNNHIRIFDRLIKNASSLKIKVFCPLSYGDPEYIKQVCEVGTRYFGSNFCPLTKYMDMDDYVYFLSTISYAIFDYDRQQGMGNIISLLGLGKGVFLNSKTTPWNFFKEESIDIIDVNSLERFDLTKDFSSDNPAKVREKFSSQVLMRQLYKVFD